MCNLSAWLRAICLMTIALLTACVSSDGEVTLESPMTLSGRVVADQPMTASDVMGTWSVVDFENYTLMGVSLNNKGELKYRLTQSDDKGVAAPAGFAKWRVVESVLIIKWPKQSGQDECVSLETAAEDIVLRCTTIGGVEDGKIIEYGFTPVNLASELPNTIWKSDSVTVHFTSSSSYELSTEDGTTVGTWSAKDLRLTLNNVAVCEFTGGEIESRWMFLACRVHNEKIEYLTFWWHEYQGESDMAQPENEAEEPSSPPPLLDSAD